MKISYQHKPAWPKAAAHMKIRHLLLAGSVLLGAFGVTSCQPVTSTNSQPTVVHVSSSLTDPTSRPEPSRPGGSPLELVADYGDFASGSSLALPAGQWLDVALSNRLDAVFDLLVESAGPGSPTLAQTLPDQPVLSLKNCGRITFRRIRFALPEQADVGLAALVELVNCREIVFEKCEFFAANGPALLLDASEHIRLLDCLFYDNDGPPLQSGDSWQPSQIRASNCLFETSASGALGLNLRASRFDDCEWIGQGGYLMPVTGTDDSLVQHLAGTLAIKLAAFSDSPGNISLTNNLFSSDEIYNLYSRLATDLPGHIPSGLAGWSISGQKSEEALPGTGLDPALGLRLELQTFTDEEPEPLYSGERLAEDLAQLRELAGSFDPLFSGDLEVLLYDQEGTGLLELSLPLASLAGLLDSFSLPALLELGRLDLLQAGLEPDAFLTRSNAQLTALALQERLVKDLCLELDPQLLYLDGEPCLISSSLEYKGTELGQVASIHNFLVRVEQQPASQHGLAGQEQGFTFSFAIDASSQDSWLRTDAGPVPFVLPELDLGLVLEALPLENLELAGADGLLQPAGAFSEQDFSLPIFLLVQEDNWYTVQTIFFTTDCQMRLVRLDLVQTQTGWELAGGELLP